MPMALKQCKDCGTPVSSSAKSCPKCGAPLKGRGLISNVARWFVIVFVIFPLAIGLFLGVYHSQTGESLGSPGSAAPQAPDPYTTAVANLDLKNLTWRTTGFGSVMEVSVTLVNKGKQNVKDVELTCDHYSNSGTKIDSNKRIIYEIVPAGKSKAIRNFNMGFIHSQAAKTSCAVTHLSLM
jgi:RNA polymerase subunit RPABC4/transcription elongation factor Spt4